MSPEQLNLPIRNAPEDLAADYAGRRGNCQPERKIAIFPGLEPLDMGLGHSPFGFPPEIRRMLDSPEFTQHLIDSLQFYPADRWSENLADSVRQRINLSPETHVSFSPGGSYRLLADILTKLVDWTPETEMGVVAVAPHFPNIATITSMANPNPDNGLAYQALCPSIGTPFHERLKHLVDDRKKDLNPKVVFIDNPCNPTGEVVPIDELDQLMKKTNRKSVSDLVIIDEAYGDTLPPSESAATLCQHYPNLIVVRGVSKGLGLSGIRLGYAITSPGPLTELWKESMELVFDVGGTNQLLASIALEPQIADSFLSEIREKTVVIKTHLIAHLSELGVEIMPTDNRVPIMLARAQNHPNFASFLTRYGIIAESGSDFVDVHPEMDNSMARLRIPGTIEDVDEAARRIELLLQESATDPEACFAD